MKIEEFKQYFTVDKHDLDTAASNQAQLYFDAADQLAAATLVRDQAKAELSQVEAMVYERIASGTEKLSDSRIRMQVAMDNTRILAERAYMVTKERADRWLVVVQSLEHRASAIRKLADLHNSGYFATQPLSARAVGRREISRG